MQINDKALQWALVWGMSQWTLSIITALTLPCLSLNCWGTVVELISMFECWNPRCWNVALGILGSIRHWKVLWVATGGTSCILQHLRILTVFSGNFHEGRRGVKAYRWADSRGKVGPVSSCGCSSWYMNLESFYCLIYADLDAGHHNQAHKVSYEIENKLLSLSPFTSACECLQLALTRKQTR